MEIQDLSFDHLPFSALYRDFTSRFDNLEEFYEVNPFSEQQIIDLAKGHTLLHDRDLLVENLINFNKPFNLDNAAISGLEALRDPDTLTVATGQQVIVYGGPSFTVYKILTTILLARSISKSTGKKVIPVFWLADEDHDYQEISQLKLPDGEGYRTFKLAGKHNHHSIGRLDVSDSFEKFRNEVKNALPETDFSPGLWNLLDEAYLNGSLKEGFARMLSALFSKYGLIFAGSDYKPFKQQLKVPIQTAIDKADLIHDALDEQSSRIEKQFHRQAQVQGTTLFMHDDQRGRVRLNHINGSWNSDSGEHWSSRELIELADKQPQRFSPNVFLRPVLQDYLLPNIAYVGGPAEIAYYGQMRSVYPIFDKKMPAIVPRLSATIMESSINRILKQLPFEPYEYCCRIEDLEKAYIEQLGHGEVNELFSDWKEEIAGISEEYTSYIAEYDASLKASAGKETASYQKSLEKLQQKLKRSIKQKEEIQLKRIRKIQQSLFPNGVLQEREISFLYFMNKYGIGIWDSILDELDSPFFDKHKLFYL